MFMKRPYKTERPMAKKIILCVLIAASLAACGVRPKHLKAPEGSTTVYPQTYPTPDAP